MCGTPPLISVSFATFFGGIQYFIRSKPVSYLKDSSTGCTSLKEFQKEASIDSVLDTIGIDARQEADGAAVTVQK